MLERPKREAPRYVQLLPELPRLLHRSLRSGQGGADVAALHALLAEQRRTKRLLQGMVYAVIGFVAGVAVMQFLMHWR